MRAINKSDFALLIHFNFWVNDRILATCEHISVDEFTRLHAPADPGWGSLRGILVHTLDTEYGWRSVLQALDENHILEADDFADVAALKAHWANVLVFSPVSSAPDCGLESLMSKTPSG